MRQGEEAAGRAAFSPRERLTGAPAIGPGGFDLVGRLRACRSEIDSAIRDVLSGGNGDPRAWRAATIAMLVAGEPVDVGGLEYPLDGKHLALVATGTAAGDAVRAAANGFGGDLLTVESGGELWAWFGSTRGGDHEDLDQVLTARYPSELSLGLGEELPGLAGWRSSHLQARAALAIAPTLGGIARYPDVALIASISRDDLLTTSLRRNFLAPLERERDGGEAHRDTLRAYFDSGRNISAAASALGVSRNTVGNRLRAIESRTSRSLADFAPEYEAALRLDALSRR